MATHTTCYVGSQEPVDVHPGTETDMIHLWFAGGAVVVVVDEHQAIELARKLTASVTPPPDDANQNTPF